MARPKLQLQIAHSPLLRYGLALLSVATACGTALLAQRYGFRNVADSLFLFAIAIPVWDAGVGPAILAVVLSSLADAYFFVELIYSIYITRGDVSHFIIFILFASLLTPVRRQRADRDLRQSRHELEQEVAVRKQQASLLNLTHDTIFSSVI
jgi:K+-sensing histidine kinase KdpD